MNRLRRLLDNTLSYFYEFGRVRAAAELARLGKHDLALKILENK
jgi:hypothetical protein